MPMIKGQRMFLHSLSSFLCKHCICGHKCDYSIVDMPSLRSARYICLAANSICFRCAQTRYDINPRSRSEHIELLMAHSCHQQYIERVSVYRRSAQADLYRRVVSLRALRYYIDWQNQTTRGIVRMESRVDTMTRRLV